MSRPEEISDFVRSYFNDLIGRIQDSGNTILPSPDIVDRNITKKIDERFEFDKLQAEILVACMNSIIGNYTDLYNSLRGNEKDKDIVNKAYIQFICLTEPIIGIIKKSIEEGDVVRAFSEACLSGTSLNMMDNTRRKGKKPKIVVKRNHKYYFK